MGLVRHFTGIDAVEDGVKPGVFERFGKFCTGGFFLSFEGLVWLGYIKAILNERSFEIGFGATEEDFEVGIGSCEGAAFKKSAVVIANNDEVFYFKVGGLGAGGVVVAATCCDETNGEHKDNGESH